MRRLALAALSIMSLSLVAIAPASAQSQCGPNGCRVDGRYATSAPAPAATIYYHQAAAPASYAQPAPTYQVQPQYAGAQRGGGVRPLRAVGRAIKGLFGGGGCGG